MAKNNESEKSKCKSWKGCGPGTSALYGLGFIGALIYFLQHANTIWTGLIGIFKAILWPAFVVYKVLEILKF